MKVTISDFYNAFFRYLNAVKLGETIVIEANTLKRGKKLAFLKAKVYRKSDNSIVAIGKQTLALFPKPNKY